MAIRNIRKEGDEILKKKSREVEVIDDKVKEFVGEYHPEHYLLNKKEIPFGVSLFLFIFLKKNIL